MGQDCVTHRRRLAEGSICSVEECSCGVLHVTLGALTLRMDFDAIAAIWVTLGEAMQRAAARREANELPPRMENAAHVRGARPS